MNSVFESKVVENIVILKLGERALDITTNPGVTQEYCDLLQSANESDEVLGYIQINDSKWDSHFAIDKMVEFVSTDGDIFQRGGRHYGYQHEVIVARFRNSLGRILKTVIQYDKPTVAGIQGKISGEYLGSILVYDSRIATADTSFSFDNLRSGLPASPGLTYLMPKYIGVGRAMSLIQSGASIDAREALSLGLISDIVDNPDDLNERCFQCVRNFTHQNSYLVKYHRQHILPGVEQLNLALERYYDAITRSIVKLRKN